MPGFDAGGARPPLHLLLVKDDGHCFYGVKGLQEGVPAFRRYALMSISAAVSILKIHGAPKRQLSVRVGGRILQFCKASKKYSYFMCSHCGFGQMWTEALLTAAAGAFVFWGRSPQNTSPATPC